MLPWLVDSTLAGAGYSWARSAVMFEQLAGVAYLAMVVSRMVALRVRHAGEGDDEPADGAQTGSVGDRS